MSNSSQNYNENSIDSKLTLLITNQENDQEERHMFRVQILTRLENIEKNTSSLDLRVSKLEANHAIYSDACNACRKKMEPIIEAHEIAINAWFSVKNIMIGLSFIIGLAATIYGFFGK